MQFQRLQIYLNDHLALMSGEVALAARCRGSNRGGSLETFLQRFEADVHEQQEVVRQLLNTIGGSESSLKQGAAWFAEKLGRFKLNDSLLSYSPLSRLVEIETLAAAAFERKLLWQELETVCAPDPRFQEFQFVALQQQSERHIEQMREHLRQASLAAFAGR